MSAPKRKGMLTISDGRDTFSEKNNIFITEVRPGYARGELTVVPDSLNFGGIVHGGALATLADVVGGTCACSKGGVCVTTNCSMEFLRPALGEKIIGEATPVKLGSTLAVVRVDLRNDQSVLVATSTFTYCMLKPENLEES